VQHVRAILQILASLQANPLQSLVCESVKAKNEKIKTQSEFLGVLLFLAKKWPGICTLWAADGT